jgi:hypothetical protein
MFWSHSDFSALDLGLKSINLLNYYRNLANIPHVHSLFDQLNRRLSNTFKRGYCLSIYSLLFTEDNLRELGTV